MRNIPLFVVCVLTLSACAISPQNPASLDDKALCYQFGRLVKSGTTSGAISEFKQEVQQRQLLPGDSWVHVWQGRLHVGDNLCAMHALAGIPDRENRTMTAAGARIQHVFTGGSLYAKPYYIYSQNGVVTAIQD